MRILRRRGPALALTLFAMLVFVLPGCTVWKRSSSPPDQVVATGKPSAIRVTVADDRKVELWFPIVVGDSLVSRSRPRKAVALSDVRAIEVQGVSASRTTLLILGVGVTIAAVAAAISFSNSNFVNFGNGGNGSCPLIHSWDGTAWRLDSGTFGGAIQEPLASSVVDNLAHATEINGQLKLRVTDQADEVEFVDALALLAADHDPALSVAPDNQGELRAFGSLTSPTRARDFSGHDARARVAALDGWAWESLVRELNPDDPAGLQDGLELDFPRPADAGPACLVVGAHDTPWVAYLMATYVQAHGRDEPAWQRQARTHPAEARAEMARLMASARLEVSLRTDGGWQRQGFLRPSGPEVARRQVLPLDLSRASGENVRIRLAGLPSFWLIDQVALAPLSPGPVSVHELTPSVARDSARGDVRALLAARDGRSYRMENGDAAELSFNVPPVAPGKARTYLARTTGWYRIHCDTTRAPDRVLLDRIAHEPAAVARISAERMNAALRTMALAP